MGKLPGVT